jgi:uncharacterized damage-inducible protein DinB
MSTTYSAEHEERAARLDELATYREHLERYRATTLQILDTLTEDRELAWSPTPESYSVGQQLLHVAQAEDYYVRGLFERDWDPARTRLDAATEPHRATRHALRAYFDEVRARTRTHLDTLAAPAALDAVQHDVPGAVMPLTLRWWLWFLLEHELHHKGQLAVYLRLMGRVAPYYAMPLPLGERPDVAVRAALGGV